MGRVKSLIYLHMPYSVLSSDLTDKEQKVMSNIISVEYGGGSYRFDNAFIADYLGCAKGSASRIVSGLKAKGLIDVELVYHPNSKAVHHRVLTLTNRAITRYVDTPLPADVNDPLPTNVEDNTNVLNIKKDNTKSPIGFDEFWNLYNHKVGKRKAEQKWKRIPQSLHPTIMAHVKLYVEATPDVTYRKHPTTYLTGEHWNDDIQSNDSETMNYDQWRAKHVQ